MEDNIRGQMSIDDIGTTTTTPQSTSAAQNSSLQERAHEHKQRIAESVQTQSDSTGRNDTAQSFTDKPKSSSQSNFRRDFPQGQRNNNGDTAPEHFHGRLNENRTNEYNTVTNANECDISTSESCETAPATAGTRHRHRKALYSNISLISDMQMLTPDDIMQALRLSRSTVYNMLKRGEIPSVKIGNMLRVNKSAFEHWLEQHTAAAHSV